MSSRGDPSSRAGRAVRCAEGGLSIFPPSTAGAPRNAAKTDARPRRVLRRSRLEAQYAHQRGIDMIPLKLQRDYNADGWLGRDITMVINRLSVLLSGFGAVSVSSIQR